MTTNAMDSELDIDLNSLDAPISEATWQAFVDAHKAHLVALEMLSDDPESQGALLYSIEHFVPVGDASGASSPAKKDDIESILREVEKSTPLGIRQAHIVADEGRGLYRAVQGLKSKLTETISSLKSRTPLPSDDEWHRECQRNCKEMCDKVIAPIKAAYASLEQLGKHNPGARGFLKGIMVAFGRFADTVLNFLYSVVEWVKKSVLAVRHAIANAVDWVADKVSRAANAVRTFFRHLF